MRLFRDLCRQNTGASILDSGSAYGRHHERPAIPDDSPVVTWGKYGPTVHTGALLDYWYDGGHDGPVQAAFDTFAAREDMRREYWADVVAAFADHMGWIECTGGNTYNGESDLDQVFQYWVFTADRDIANGDWYFAGDECIVAIQTHNGCDVRGGYSSPVWVRATGGDEGYPIPMTTCAGFVPVEARDPDGDEVNPWDVPGADRLTTGYTSAPFYQFESDGWRLCDWTRNEIEATCCAISPDGYVVKFMAEVEGVY